MSEEQKKIVIDSLVRFIERAASQKATSVEVTTLPEVVNALRLLSTDEWA